MDVTITDRPAFVLAGHAAEVPLVYQGVNPHIQQHIASIAPAEHARLKTFNNAEPAGILAVTDGNPPDAPEGTPITYLHGVAVQEDSTVPADLSTIAVAPGAWATFRSSGRSRLRSRKPGRQRQPSGSRRIRGDCDPGPRSFATWN